MSGPRLLIVSLGSIGRRHLRVARDALPKAEIAVLRRPQAAAEPPPAGADHLFRSIDDAIAFAPEFAIVASPASLRAATAQALLESGAHLLLEKPLAPTRADADALIEAAAMSDRVVQIGYQLRFLPVLSEARRRLAAGEIGVPRLARFEVGQYLPDWRPGDDYRHGVSAQSALGGGALLELSHEIDLALWMLGQPETVTASVARLGDLEIDVEDCATVTMDRAGCSATVHLDFLQRVARRRMLVIGSEASLEVDLIAQTGVIRSPAGETALDAPPTGAPDETYLRQLDAFCARILSGHTRRYPEAATPCSVEDAAVTLAVIDAAREAARTGRRQSIAACSGGGAA